MTEVPQVKQCSEPCNADAHEVCDTSPEEPACTCAAGYSGTPCEWAGVLQDPGFEDTEAWTRTNGATVLPFEKGPTDSGVAFLAPSVVCNAGAVSQTVEMPSYAVAEPLVAEVTYRARGVYGLSLGFNRAWTALSETVDDEWQTERVCLGEAAFGGPVLFQVGSREQHPSCFDDPVGDIQVDHLSIQVADPGECPALGEVLNGEAEEDRSGWRFLTTGSAEAGFAPGVGHGETTGVRISRETSGHAAASTKLSVPLAASVPSPAIRFWWRGTEGRRFHFEIGRFVALAQIERPIDDVIGSGSELDYVYCLPPWTHGNVVDLSFMLILDTSAERTELVVDDLEIVSDARCGDSTDLLDPGFDAAPNRFMGLTHFTANQSATLLRDSTLARSGDGVLELAYWNSGAIMQFETWVLVPESNGEVGPAVAFYSNIPAGTQKPFRSVLGRAAVSPADLPVGGGWRRNEVCLFPEWSGRWFRVQVWVGQVPPMGADPIDPPSRIYLDDFELTTSPACRAD